MKIQAVCWIEFKKYPFSDEKFEAKNYFCCCFVSIYLTSLTWRPGGSDCFSFSAFSLSNTTRVYKYLEQRILNFVLFSFFFILTALASFLRALIKKSLTSLISCGISKIDKIKWKFISKSIDGHPKFSFWQKLNLLEWNLLENFNKFQRSIETCFLRPTKSKRKGLK